MRPAALLAAILAASPAAAQDDAAEEIELRPAPVYFIAATIASTTAQEVARGCPALSLDPPKVQALSERVLARLQEDGFDISRADGGMLPTAMAFSEAQQTFLLKHGLTGVITTDLVCAAGRAEIAEGTELGNLLVEVPE